MGVLCWLMGFCSGLLVMLCVLMVSVGVCVVW